MKYYFPGDSFGELALLYNAPRAASIKAMEECILWALDRETFNHIVKDAAMYFNYVKNSGKKEKDMKISLSQSIF